MASSLGETSKSEWTQVTRKKKKNQNKIFDSTCKNNVQPREMEYAPATAQIRETTNSVNELSRRSGKTVREGLEQLPEFEVHADPDDARPEDQAFREIHDPEEQTKIPVPLSPTPDFQKVLQDFTETCREIYDPEPRNQEVVLTKEPARQFCDSEIERSPLGERLEDNSHRSCDAGLKVSPISPVRTCLENENNRPITSLVEYEIFFHDDFFQGSDEERFFPPGFTPNKEELETLREMLKEGADLIPLEHHEAFAKSVDLAEEGKILEFFQEKFKESSRKKCDPNYLMHRNVRRSPRMRKLPAKLINPSSMSGLKKGFLK